MKNKMIGKTGIEYGDYAFNPIRGCSGEGCAVKDKCWAKGMNKRFGYVKDFSQPEFSADILNRRMPKKPSRILTCFTGDILDKGVKVEWRQKVYNVINKHSQHTYFVLTKHPERCSKHEWLGLPRNIVFGVTINKQKDFDKLCGSHLLICGIKYWISFEPLLSYIEIPYYANNFEWFVIGGMQGGKEPRPKKEWIENIVKYARKYNIPIFMKDNLKSVWNKPLIKQFPKGV